MTLSEMREQWLSAYDILDAHKDTCAKCADGRTMCSGGFRMWTTKETAHRKYLEERERNGRIPPVGG